MLPARMNPHHSAGPSPPAPRTAAMALRATSLVLVAIVFPVVSDARPSPAPTPGGTDGSWTFVVGGDSRNCGDVVMPAVAAGARSANAGLYWHLGDFRALYDFDQDYLQEPEHRGKRNTIADYQRTAWDDFIQSQLAPFGSIPVLLAIGNHELVLPKTRLDYVASFADWIASPEIRDQRLRDDPNDHRARTWYHVIRGGVDFITLDNAAPDTFETEQVRWFEGVVSRAEKDPAVRAIAVGMHAALPDSLASDHSMNDWAQGEQSGRKIYARLVEANKKKRVYILSSHSHFYMSGIFQTEAHKRAGTVLPGWIVGTTGAIRYALPPRASEAAEAKTNVYGYLLARVQPDDAEPIRFEFREIRETELPAETVERFGADFVHQCFAENISAPRR